MRIGTRRLLAVSAASLLLVGGTGSASAEEPLNDQVTDLPVALVDDLDRADQQTLSDLTEGEGIQLEAFVKTPDGPRIVTLDAGGRADAAAAVELLERQRSVEAADLTVVAQPAAGAFVQWGNATVRSDAARAEVSAGALADVVVAVLDTGVYPHEELTSALLPGMNFTSSPGGPSDTSDRHGHGTHVSGTVAADAGSLVEGVAAGAKVLPVKVLSDEGSGLSSWISRGIIWAADQGADVINMSLSGQHSSTVYNAAVAYARSQGTTVVAAAGNQSTSAITMPAAAPGVIGVAATDEFGGHADFSNFGDYVDVSAPGTGILSTSSEYGYGYMSGTSMAAPHVAGVVALMEAAAPALTPDQVEHVLTASATDLGAAGRDDLFGYGQIDAVRAVRGAKALAGSGTLPTNRAPVAVADAFFLPHNPGTGTLQVLANDTDPDGDELTVVSATRGTSGTVTTTPAALRYTPTRSGPFVDTVSYTVSDNRGGTAVGTVTVSIAGSPTPVVRIPAAPRIGTPTVLSGGVRLSWTAPVDDGGAPITGYRVSAYRGSTLVTSAVVNSRTTTTTLSRLSNGTTYRFGVSAVNSAGSGPASALVTATPRTVPSAPKITSVTAQPKAVAVRWAKPASTGGAPVTGYVIRAYAGTKTVKTVTARASATSVTVSGLSNGTFYRVGVEALNAAGAGPRSALLTATPRTTPSSPRISSVTAQAKAVAVRWAKPASTGGAPVTGYVVRVYAGGKQVKTATARASATSVTVRGLSAGKSYSVRVLAKNAAGLGASSANSKVVRPR